MDGLLLVDKPSGPTSFDVVRDVRRAFNTRKVGHAGTLDPLASGLLAVCLGQGTKLVPYLMDSEKRYLAKICLGSQTNTDDSMGEVVEEASVPTLVQGDVERVLSGFMGEIEQVPPIFSALKRDGEALYKKARRGEEVKIEPRLITIHEINLVEIEDESLELEVRCGKGTYIRSLARDLGIALGTRAHLCALRRTYTSGFSVDEAISLDRLMAEDKPDRLRERLLWNQKALPGYAIYDLEEKEEAFVRDGRSVMVDLGRISQACENGLLVLLGKDGRLAAIGRTKENGLIKMERVFS